MVDGIWFRHYLFILSVQNKQVEYVDLMFIQNGQIIFYGAWVTCPVYYSKYIVLFDYQSFYLKSVKVLNSVTYSFIFIIIICYFEILFDIIMKFNITWIKINNNEILANIVIK